MNTKWIIAVLTLMVLAYAQNISFTIVSRARNRSSWKYHLVASILSNGVWFLTFRQLVVNEMNWILFIPYNIATVAGSLTGATVSMRIEKWPGATSDSHLKPPS